MSSIANSGVINYLNVSGTPVSFISTTASTTINTAVLNMTKQVNKAYADVGDILTYTIPIRNTGNVTASTVVFIDTLPSGATLVAGSYKQDGTVLSGTPNPPGTTLPNGIAPGTVSTVTFQIQINTIPTPNPIANTATATATYLINPLTTPLRYGNVSGQSNTVTTSITSVSNPQKVADKSNVAPGETIGYTLVWTNRGGETQTNVTFIDTIPDGTLFQVNSIRLNGGTQLGATITPPTGFNSGTLAVGSVATVSFVVEVVSVPLSNQISNQGIVSQTEGATVSQHLSNSVISSFVRADLSGITKSVDKAYADCGDTLTYSVALPNSGNTSATNVVFKDTLPNGTTLIPDSVYLNGMQQLGANPATGLTVGIIGPGATASIVFSVKIQC